MNGGKRHFPFVNPPCEVRDTFWDDGPVAKKRGDLTDPLAIKAVDMASAFQILMSFDDLGERTAILQAVQFGDMRPIHSWLGREKARGQA